MKQLKHFLKRTQQPQTKLINPVDLLKNSKDPVMLNVGCGTDYKKHWINIDNNTDNNIEAEKLDLNWDLRNPLPFPDNSVDFIFNEHFMEHLSPEEGIHANKDFLRVLKKGGVLRIAMPDLEDSVALYQAKNWREHPVLKGHNLESIKTRAELINMSFRWWDHKWLYDWEELQRRLEEAGATKIKRAKHNASSHKQLNKLETRGESTLIAEVTK